MNDSPQLVGAKSDMLGCIFSVDLWGIEQGRGGYFWLLFEGTIWLLGETVSATNCERSIAATLFVVQMWPWVSHRTVVKKKKKHEQQSASAAVPSMATIKDKSQNWPMNRRRESNNVRGVGWWAGAEIRWRDLDEVKILSRWFRFFLCPWWPSAQGQAHSWRATDSWHQWHQKAAALYHNWPAAPILVHHMTLTSSSYPYSQGDITASLGWMWECEVLLCAKNIVLCVAVTCYRLNETEGCTRLLWLFNCRKSWCSLNRAEVTSSLLTLVTTSGSSQSNIKNSKSPIWTLDWTVWTEI